MLRVWHPGEVTPRRSSRPHLRDRKRVRPDVRPDPPRRLKFALGKLIETAARESTIGNVAAIALYRSCGFEFVAEAHGRTKAL